VKQLLQTTQTLPLSSQSYKKQVNDRCLFSISLEVWQWVQTV